jgi:diadenosine tetraphosphate (Ap4A) HIT family hydrolase
MHKMNDPGCDFCNEFAGRQDNAFSRIYGASKSRVLFRTGELIVAPSIGQIVEGYLLILPLQHFRASGDLPAGSLVEVGKLLEQVGQVLNKEYGTYVLFEHGTRDPGYGGCGIYHAHVHALPFPAAADPIEMLKHKFSYREFDEFREIGVLAAGLPSYLFYRDSSGRFYLFDTGALPSQYMRRTLSDALGLDAWDWRLSGREERLLCTLGRLSDRFNKAPCAP